MSGTRGLSRPAIRRIAAMATLSVMVALSGAAVAQPRTAAKPAGPMAGFGSGSNSKEPIKIESLALELRDKEKIATFIDNVKVVQGDTTLECKRLVVYYDEDPATSGKKGGAKPAKVASANPAGPAGGGSQQIRKLEAMGGVVLTQKDQTATGDNGVYDMKTNTMVLTGNVVLVQGQNVVRGNRLHVDMASGLSRIESEAGTQGRVIGVFTPNSVKDDKPPAPAAAPKTRPGSGAPSRSAERDRDSNRPASARPPMKLN